MKYLLLICFALSMSCSIDSETANANDSTSTKSSLEPVVTDTAAAIVTPSCYALQTSNNLVLLKLNTVSPAVSGQLTYAIMGKDKNEGAISGTMRGDTLFADYKFMLEGKDSVRSVVFLRKGDSFVEGSGNPKQNRNGSFSKSDTLHFNGTVILKKIPCANP